MYEIGKNIKRAMSKTFYIWYSLAQLYQFSQFQRLDNFRDTCNLVKSHDDFSEVDEVQYDTPLTDVDVTEAKALNQ